MSYSAVALVSSPLQVLNVWLYCKQEGININDVRLIFVYANSERSNLQTQKVIKRYFETEPAEVKAHIKDNYSYETNDYWQHEIHSRQKVIKEIKTALSNSGSNIKTVILGDYRPITFRQVFHFLSEAVNVVLVDDGSVTPEVVEYREGRWKDEVLSKELIKWRPAPIEFKDPYIYFEPRSITFFTIYSSIIAKHSNDDIILDNKLFKEWLVKDIKVNNSDAWIIGTNHLEGGITDQYQYFAALSQIVGFLRTFVDKVTYFSHRNEDTNKLELISRFYDLHVKAIEVPIEMYIKDSQLIAGNIATIASTVNDTVGTVFNGKVNILQFVPSDKYYTGRRIEHIKKVIAQSNRLTPDIETYSLEGLQESSLFWNETLSIYKELSSSGKANEEFNSNGRGGVSINNSLSKEIVKNLNKSDKTINTNIIATHNKPLQWDTVDGLNALTFLEPNDKVILNEDQVYKEHKISFREIDIKYNRTLFSRSIRVYFRGRSIILLRLWDKNKSKNIQCSINLEKPEMRAIKDEGFGVLFLIPRECEDNSMELCIAFFAKKSGLYNMELVLLKNRNCDSSSYMGNQLRGIAINMVTNKMDKMLINKLSSPLHDHLNDYNCDNMIQEICVFFSSNTPPLSLLNITISEKQIPIVILKVEDKFDDNYKEYLFNIFAPLVSKPFAVDLDYLFVNECHHFLVAERQDVQINDLEIDYCSCINDLIITTISDNSFSEEKSKIIDLQHILPFKDESLKEKYGMTRLGIKPDMGHDDWSIKRVFLK